MNYGLILSFLAAFGTTVHCTLSSDKGCDLSEVQKCLGGVTELSSTINLNPVQIDLLTSIKRNYCGHGYEDCLEQATGGCTDRELAPYKTISATVEIVCKARVDYTNTCLRQEEVQHHLKYCFALFKTDIDHTVGDTMLTSDGVNKGLCRAYEYVSTCVYDVSSVLCSIRDAVYVNGLVRGSTKPTTSALQCKAKSAM